MSTNPKTPRRIYLVRDVDTGIERLIRAVSPAQARAHAARDVFEVSVATQDQLVALLTAEIPAAVEEAGQDEPPQVERAEVLASAAPPEPLLSRHEPMFRDPAMNRYPEMYPATKE